MATPEIIARRRAEAETQIESSVSALADHFGVKLEAAESFPVRDMELKRVIGLERVASQLAQIGAALKPKQSAEVETEEARAEPAKADAKKSKGK